tara:strand:- start:94 stop:369 length:276 start_codon:yes stop_codon:yes gene_type:complete
MAYKMKGPSLLKMVEKEKKHFLQRNKVGPIADVKKLKVDDKEDEVVEAMENREVISGNTFLDEQSRLHDIHAGLTEGTIKSQDLIREKNKK